MRKYNRRLLFFVLTVSFLTTIVFGFHLEGDYLWDDLPQIGENPAITDDDGYITILTSDLWGGAGARSTQLYHPIPMLSFWLQAKLTDRSIVAFRVVNILIHIANIICLFFLMRRFSVREKTAFFFSLLLSVHPSVTEPVMWLTGRHDSLAVLFSLLSFIAWPRSSSQRIRLRIALSTFCVAAAFLCKEPYIVVFLLVPMFDILCDDTNIPKPTRYMGYAVLPLGVAAVFAVRAALGISSGSDELYASVSTHITTFGTILGHYLAQIFSFSNGITTQNYEPLTFAAALLVVTGIFAVITLLLILQRRSRAPFKLWAAGLVWFTVSLSPHIVSLPNIGMYGNRYAYFPMMGLGITAAAAAQYTDSYLSPSVRRLVAIVGVLLTCALAIRTFGEAKNWRNDLALYGADIERAPDDPKTLYHFGHAVRKRFGCEKALFYFRRSSKHDPDYWRPLHNQAGCLINLRRYKEALTPAAAAVRLAPNDPRSLYNLGIAEIYTGKKSKGLSLLQKAARLAPDYLPARRMLKAFKEDE